MPFGDEVIKKFEDLKKNCLKCHKFLANNLKTSLECCGQMSKECFRNEISSELDMLNKDKKENLICFICKNSLRTHEIEEILGITSCKEYMKFFQDKKNVKVVENI